MSLHVIVGLGASGFSCVQYLKKYDFPIAVTDSRLQPPFLEAMQKTHPEVPLSLGGLDKNLLAKAERIILSPGVSLQEKVIQEQLQRGVPVIGDIELFAQAVKAPVIAITGTNAKSTVTTLVGKMAEEAGYHVKIGGNLGTPALNLLQESHADLYVLELSSFQLETSFTLKPHVATILNITPDHMDRYASLFEYQQAKQRIYHQCLVAVSNRDDALTDCEFAPRKLKFTLQKPQENEFGLLRETQDIQLAYENTPLISVKELPIVGKHYQANALAALALGSGFGLPIESMLSVLRTFPGLPHRCQLVREHDGVKWYNDSKGTNVGATIAAIDGLGSDINGKLILIAGGLGKNADFQPLLPSIKNYVRHVILIGEAGKEIANVIGKQVATSFALTMQEAVQQAASVAKTEDSVLLSPACASFDMFKNFEHRGQVFTEVVKKLK